MLYQYDSLLLAHFYRMQCLVMKFVAVLINFAIFVQFCKNCDKKSDAYCHLGVVLQIPADFFCMILIAHIVSRIDYTPPCVVVGKWLP